MVKTKLRPGGIDATNWLIGLAGINADTKILEVACNRAKTMIQLCKQFGCNVTGIDLDEKFLEIARQNIQQNHLEDKLKVIQGNVLSLPFDDSSFDVVINEAMLTMLLGEQKEKALKECFRVLKPSGLLLTHDVAFRIAGKDVQKEIRIGLSRAINANVEPLDADGWKSVLEGAGFTVNQKVGTMTLMSPRGMIRDEGLKGTLKIIHNARKKENKEMFQKMFTFFKANKQNLGYI